MKHHSRRDVLKELGMGAAVFSMGAGSARPEGGSAERPSENNNAKPVPGSLMAIAAHPGDALFTMGAAVARQVSTGGRGVFLNLTHGERGNPAVDPAEYGAMQVTATDKAAKMLGAETAYLSYPDGELPDNEEARFAVCDAIRQHKPEIIITHWKGSYHKDHRACFNIVDDAIFYAGLPGIKRRSPAHSVNKLLYAENWEDAEGFRQDIYLDISDVFNRWVEASAVFPMWRGETGFHYDDYYKSLAVARGSLARIGQKDGSLFRYAVALMSPPNYGARRTGSLSSPAITGQTTI
ncbi:MAG: PIG-L family deacetylase [Acidobacteria bacterium]|nr:MAG: PIG-L family deacetylase [Acidobacteriota bacterium]